MARVTEQPPAPTQKQPKEEWGSVTPSTTSAYPSKPTPSPVGGIQGGSLPYGEQSQRARGVYFRESGNPYQSAPVPTPPREPYDRLKIIKLLEGGDYNHALVKVLDWVNIKEVLWVLDEAIGENMRRDILAPASLTFSTFSVLIHQLSNDLTKDSNLVEVRIKWLNAFLTAWNGVLSTVFRAYPQISQTMLGVRGITGEGVGIVFGILANVQDELRKVSSVELDSGPLMNLNTIIGRLRK